LVNIKVHYLTISDYIILKEIKNKLKTFNDKKYYFIINIKIIFIKILK
jgi:hypothetical protein